MWIVFTTYDAAAAWCYIAWEWRACKKKFEGGNLDIIWWLAQLSSPLCDTNAWVGLFFLLIESFLFVDQRGECTSWVNRSGCCCNSDSWIAHAPCIIAVWEHPSTGIAVSTALCFSAPLISAAVTKLVNLLLIYILCLLKPSRELLLSF